MALSERSVDVLVEAVREYAKANYGRGWDVVVETFTYHDIVDELTVFGATTPEEAVQALEPHVMVWRDQRESIDHDDAVKCVWCGSWKRIDEKCGCGEGD